MPFRRYREEPPLMIQEPTIPDQPDGFRLVVPVQTPINEPPLSRDAHTHLTSVYRTAAAASLVALRLGLPAEAYTRINPLCVPFASTYLSRVWDGWGIIESWRPGETISRMIHTCFETPFDALDHWQRQRFARTLAAMAAGLGTGRSGIACLRIDESWGYSRAMPCPQQPRTRQTLIRDFLKIDRRKKGRIHLDRSSLESPAGNEPAARPLTDRISFMASTLLHEASHCFGGSQDFYDLSENVMIHGAVSGVPLPDDAYDPSPPFENQNREAGAEQVTGRRPPHLLIQNADTLALFIQTVAALT